MLRQYDATTFKEYEVKEGVKTSCLIPLMPEVSFDLSVRCEKEVTVSLVQEDGQMIPMEVGKIVNMRGRNRNFHAIEISTETTFWYRAIVSRTDEFVDPTPVKVELTQTTEDVLRSMIDERLRAWKVKQELERDLTEEEKDELLLDMIHGDLEFDDEPDQFGLGYEERLAEFTQRHAEQSNPEGVSAPSPEKAGNEPAEGSNSSAT